VVGYQRFGGPCCLHLQGEMSGALIEIQIAVFRVVTLRSVAVWTRWWKRKIPFTAHSWNWCPVVHPVAYSIYWLSYPDSSFTYTATHLFIRPLVGETLRREKTWINGEQNDIYINFLSFLFLSSWFLYTPMYMISDYCKNYFIHKQDCIFTSKTSIT